MITEYVWLMCFVWVRSLKFQAKLFFEQNHLRQLYFLGQEIPVRARFQPEWVQASIPG